MTITEFIAKLEQLRAEHGDLPVGMLDGCGFLITPTMQGVVDSEPYPSYYHFGPKVVLI